MYTLELRGGAEPQSDQLELVDLVGEALDEGLEEGYPLRGALGLLEEVDQLVGQLVPQLALPVVLEVDEVLLQLLRRLVPRVAEQVRYCVRVHRHADVLCVFCNMGYEGVGGEGRAWVVVVLRRCWWG